MESLSTQTTSSLNRNAQVGQSSLKLSIASTFTSNPVEDVLRFWSKKFGYNSTVLFSPYDQVFQELLDQNSSLNHPDNDARVVFIKMDDWIRSLPDTGELSVHSHIGENINSLCEYAAKAAAYVEAPLFVIITRNSKGSLISPEKQSTYEQRIINDLSVHSNIYVTTSGEIDKRYGVVDYYDAQKDELGHIPFKSEYFTALATAVFRNVLAGKRKPYKVIVLDCDNTLWGGVCGEVPPERLSLSQPYSDLQSFMLRQMTSGKILCLCSKNVQEDVDRVFFERPDMLLREEDIVSSKINWQPKSQNIKELAEELNLGLDSFIFVDDNPLECAEVRANCPEVVTLSLPERLEDIGTFLDHVWVFDTLKSTSEDKKRTRLYRENIKRSSFQDNSSSLKEFLEGLNLDISIKDAAPDEIGRVSQLTCRTNQFNFTTIRRSEEEIKELLGSDEFVCKVCRVKDRFGDYGLVGAMLYKILPDRILLDSFMLSCRVLGRGVEHNMLRSVGEAARAHGSDSVQINFGETEKNLPARNFLQSVIVGHSGNTPLTNDGDDGYVMPSDYLSGLIYDPDIQKYGETRNNGQVKKAVSNVPVEQQGEIYEQIAKELHHPSNIDGLLHASKDSYTRKPLASSAATDRDPQQIITVIWETILDRAVIGPDEHFFDVGGTSLKAVEVLSQLNEQFNRNLTIVSLFEYSTIRLLAELVEGKVENNSELDRVIKRAASRRNHFRERKFRSGH